MKLGRPPKDQNHEVRIGKFLFDANYPEHRALAKFLRHAVPGARANRILDLVIAGNKERLLSLGKDIDPMSARKKRRTVVIDDISFEMTIASHAACVDYLSKSEFRSRRQKILKLMLAGHAAKQSYKHKEQKS